MQTATIFNLETVPLDDEVFADCEFRECRMVYSGGKPPVFDNCRFDACDWRFDDSAARTLAHLKVIWAAGGKAQVQAMIKEITGGGGK
ncbi:MAG: hypothetical protein K9G59_16510 [Caulobacter sp.]|jgi:hypothetical protein|nr:hypothetical protein [Caulobacter sp.]